MKALHILGLALGALAAGFGGCAEAGDTAYRSASSHNHGGARTVYVSAAVPLLFYTCREYSSSVFGSPDDGISNVPKYFGSSSYSSKYYRYRSNLWYTDKVYTRYAVVDSLWAADVQRELARRGYYQGSIDGVLGPMSRSAIVRYQQRNGMRSTGEVDEGLLRSLGLR
jgi:hypothetical protein